MTQGLQAGHGVGFIMYWWSQSIAYSQRSLANTLLCALVALQLHSECLYNSVACLAPQIAMHMFSDWAPFAGGANKASGGVGKGTGAARGAGATGAAAQVTP